MTDPFDVLRIADTPLDPRPAFAADLRRQLTTDLETTNLETTNLETTMTSIETATATATQTVTAYLSVRNAAGALAFYAEAFGAVEHSRLVGDDGRIGHAEVTIGSSKMMLADEYPEIDIVGPRDARWADVLVHHRGPRRRCRLRTCGCRGRHDRSTGCRPVPRQSHGKCA